MIREDPNPWGSVVEEKLELHEGAYRGLKKPSTSVELTNGLRLVDLILQSTCSVTLSWTRTIKLIASHKRTRL
eukprot:scaffold6433_cov125-Cylindrotheca_fusiformis.AAC.2